MKHGSLFRTLAVATAFSATSLQSSEAALTITLHPDGNGGTVVEIFGSGTTPSVSTSQLTTVELAEQWINMTGDPFKATLSDSIHLFNTPIQIADGVNIVGIQVDSDDTTSGPGQDDFRIYIDNEMSTETPYSASGITTLQTSLAHSELNIGSYTDDDDGGTTFLGGFTLVIDNNVVPEPSVAGLSALALGALALRRKRA